MQVSTVAKKKNRFSSSKRSNAPVIEGTSASSAALQNSGMLLNTDWQLAPTHWSPEVSHSRPKFVSMSAKQLAEKEKQEEERRKKKERKKEKEGRQKRKKKKKEASEGERKNVV